MIPGFLTLFSLASVLLFPWPMTVIAALVSALFVPLLPLSMGIFADALYWAPGAASLPYATLLGAIVSAIAYIVRDHLAPGIIER